MLRRCGAPLQDAIAWITAGTHGAVRPAGTAAAAGAATPTADAAANGGSATPTVGAAANAGVDPPLTVIELPTETHEIEFMAGEIRRLTQSCGYRFKDMAIALCEPQTQLPMLRAAAGRYELSLFLDETRSLAGTSLLRYMLGLLDLPLRNWARDPVMTVLRSGLTPLDPQQVDLLENDMLARGLFRRDRLFAAARVANPDTADAAALRISEVVRTIFEPMRRLTDSLRKVETTGRMLPPDPGFLYQPRLDGPYRGPGRPLRAQGEADAALLLASAHGVLGQVLEQLETIAGALPMNLADLRDTLRSGLANASVTLIPSALDQIMVGDWRRISRQPCRVLFVLGARLDTFPPKSAPEGLLKDLDRQYLSGTLAIHLPSKVRDQAFADAANLHQLLTRPIDRLYLGTSGRRARPEIVAKLMRAIPDCRLVSDDQAADFWNPSLNARPAACIA